jgi:hypothetical protein
MIEEIPARCGNCIGFRARGKLTEDDYTRVLIPGIEKGIESYSKVNILFQVEDFKGWTAGGAWEDLMNWPKFRHVRKFALVGDQSWDEVLTKMMKIFAALTHSEVRFFRIDRIDEAWDWLGTEK